MYQTQLQEAKEALSGNKNYSNLFKFSMEKENGIIFDLSEHNRTLRNIDCTDPERFSEYIFTEIQKSKSRFGIGKYGEKRVIYDGFDIFSHKRDIHLGIDIWVPEGETVHTPLDAEVIFSQNDYEAGGYGPTITLKHSLSGLNIYTIYGHLGKESLNNLKAGQKLKAGQPFASIGGTHENGFWPPHLHFQITTELFDEIGIFPGVTSQEEQDYYMSICPNPNLILQINKLTPKP